MEFKPTVYKLSNGKWRLEWDDKNGYTQLDDFDSWHTALSFLYCMYAFEKIDYSVA